MSPPNNHPLDEGKRLARAGKYEEALQQFRQVDNSEGRYYEAAALYKLGRLDEARVAVEACLDRDPGHEKAEELRRTLENPQAAWRARREPLMRNRRDPMLLALGCLLPFGLLLLAAGFLLIGRSSRVPPAAPLTAVAVMAPVATVQPAAPAMTNGDFEGPFVNGVASGWTGVNISGAVFKANPKLGPIGGGLYGASHGKEDERTIAMSGKINLVDVARHDMVSKINEALGPEVMTIVKLSPEDYFDGRPLDGDPYTNGVEFADYCYRKSEETGHWAHAYYGQNEPHMNDAGDLANVARFELGFTRRLHEHGLRSVVINHSVGTPGPKENMYIPEMRELLAEADYFGYHSYGAPQSAPEGGQLMCGEKSLEEYSLRWRQFAAEYNRRGWRFPPVIYTEGTTYGGWTDTGNITPDDILQDLICFSDKMKEDPWAIGLCVFATGAWPGQVWLKWDISQFPEIMDGVREYNLAHPVDAHEGTGAQQITGAGSFDGAIVQPVNTPGGGTVIRLLTRICAPFLAPAVSRGSGRGQGYRWRRFGIRSIDG